MLNNVSLKIFLKFVKYFLDNLFYAIIIRPLLSLKEFTMRAEEDYLKIIYEKIQNTNNEFVTNQEIQAENNHAIQTINRMINTLDAKDYIVYTPYKGSKLTEKGHQKAKYMHDIHNVWEYFLIDRLGYSEEESHDLAEKLEHASNQDLYLKLVKYLNQ